MNNQQNQLNDKTITRIASFFKVIGDETRVKIIYTLANGELSVNAIAQTLSMTQSAISHQLKSLKLEGFVQSRRDGKNIYYSLDDEHIVDLLHTASIHIQHKIQEEQ